MYNDNLIQPPAKHSPGLGQGAQKGPEWAQNEQKLGKYVPKRELLVRYYQDLLSTGPRDIYNDNLTWSLAKHSPDLGQGAQKEPEWAQNDQQSQKRYMVSGSLCPLISFFDVSYLVSFVVRGQRPRRGR